MYWKEEAHTHLYLLLDIKSLRAEVVYHIDNPKSNNFRFQVLTLRRIWHRGMLPSWITLFFKLPWPLTLHLSLLNLCSNSSIDWLFNVPVFQGSVSTPLFSITIHSMSIKGVHSVLCFKWHVYANDY